MREMRERVAGEFLDGMVLISVGMNIYISSELILRVFSPIYPGTFIVTSQEFHFCLPR